MIYDFSQDWLYKADDPNDYGSPAYRDDAWEPIHLPHTNRLLPHKDFSPSEYQFVSWYRRHFNVPSGAEGKRVTVTFDGVMAVATVYVNGQLVGEHKGGYTSFTMDISAFVKMGGENVIAVKVDSTRRTDVPPEGFLVDYMLFGGIYRRAYLTVHNQTFLDDVFLYTAAMEGDEATLRGELAVIHEGGGVFNGSATVTLTAPDGRATKERVNVTVDTGSRKTIPLAIRVDQPLLWSPRTPNLYDIHVQLDTDDGAPLDDLGLRTGIRTVKPVADGLLLNGEKMKLRGLNRHQMFPYIGNAAPERLQRRDAEILKRELGLNYVRTSHYPQDPAFIDACDELGLLVFTEMPGWQHIGDMAWKQVGVQNVQDMILRDRNHPSIFMWGVRINESPDDHDFFTETNRLAHALDPSRPTGGVRNFRQSEALEDVFTINDFSMTVLPTTHTPQLVTEYLGHMFPTKLTDEEPRLVQHALLHAGIVNGVYGRDDVMGSSGWCAFDYNTHAAFGPGDMVCYHGVMDMFREPKFAAKLYQSQQDPEDGIVLSPATYFAFAGAEHDKLLAELVELSVMEEAITRDSYATDVYVFSNCDEIEVRVNGELRGRFAPQKEDFPHLPHPPFRFPVHGYRMCGTVEVMGYLGGRAVATSSVTTPMGMNAIVIEVDDDVLLANGRDMTRVTVRAVDKNGSTCPYANRAVSFSLEGEGVLVGENPVAMEGGHISVFVKSSTRPGSIRVTANAFGVPSASMTIESTEDSSLRVPPAKGASVHV